NGSERAPGCAIVPDRPGVGGRKSTHAGKNVRTRTWARALDLRPGCPVPVKDQGLINGSRNACGYAIVPDRPGVVGRESGHAEEEVLARAWAGALDLRPGYPVPVKDQRLIGIGDVVRGEPDCPGVSRPVRAHAEEEVQVGAGVGALG